MLEITAKLDIDKRGHDERPVGVEDQIIFQNVWNSARSVRILIPKDGIDIVVDRFHLIDAIRSTSL